MINSDLIKSRFKSCGYKLTNQRKAILDVLIENEGRFLSVEEICQKSKKKHPQTNLTTIYRNMDILEEIGIVHKTTLSGSNSLIYEIICSDKHHHHIICKGCGKTNIIDTCPFEDIKRLVSEEDFIITEHKIELYGYCKECMKKI